MGRLTKLLVGTVMVFLLAGYAYGDDISDKLEQEALAVINAHKSKLDAEDAVQRAKDAEIEKQRNLQAEALKKERLSQEQMKQAAAKAEEERAKAEAERKRRADLELRIRAAELEEARRARKAQIIRDMQQALERVDARWDEKRAREEKEIQDIIRANRQQRALEEINSQLSDIQAQQQQPQQVINQPIFIVPRR